jgi:hypothetical protein
MKLQAQKVFFWGGGSIWTVEAIFVTACFTESQMGPDNATEKEWGVNYRALNDLFSISHDRRDTIKYELGVQMVEIYNEQIRDLLGIGVSQKKYPSYQDFFSSVYSL